MYVARTVLESVAKSLSDTHDVQVVFYGNECHTDGIVITLPSLPEKVPENMIMKLRGFLDHEAGHIAFTDFDDYRKLPKNNIERFALNAIEDIRIELKMEIIWKGCKTNFERAHDDIVKKILKPKRGMVKWEDQDPLTKILILFIEVARYGYDGELFAKHSIEYGPIIDELADEIAESRTLESTKAAYELAVRVLAKIEHAVDEMTDKKWTFKTKSKGKSKKGDSKGKSKSKSRKGKESSSKSSIKSRKKSDSESVESDESDSDSEDHGKDKPEKKDESAEESPADEADDKDTDESESESPDSKSSDSDETPDDEDEDEDDEEMDEEDEFLESLRESLETDVERKLPDISDDIVAETKKLKGYRVLTTKQDTFEAWEDKSRRGFSTYEEFKKQTHGVVAVLKNKLNRLLMSRKRSRWEGGKRNGVINPATLHMAVQGTSDKLYRHRREGARINTAVSILVDLSGSMGGGKIRKATETAVLLAETLNLTNIPFEILGFSGDHRHSREGSRFGFDRYGSLDMFYFKLFSENLSQKVKRRIGSMTNLAQNYDGESVRFAANRLLRRPERKKVLFVLSDGEPCARYCKKSILSPHLKQVCSELEKVKDFYLCAFGIETDAPKNFYKNHVVVNDLNELPKTLMESLYRAFL